MTVGMGKHGRQAIIDIGSNSIRLVVFGGDPRTPTVLYDDKVQAQLGRGVVALGKLDRRGVALALATLGRFAALLRLKLGVEMSVVLAAPGALAPLTGIEVRQKPVRLIDKRFS